MGIEDSRSGREAITSKGEFFNQEQFDEEYLAHKEVIDDRINKYRKYVAPTQKELQRMTKAQLQAEHDVFKQYNPIKYRLTKIRRELLDKHLIEAKKQLGYAKNAITIDNVLGTIAKTFTTAKKMIKKLKGLSR